MNKKKNGNKFRIGICEVIRKEISSWQRAKQILCRGHKKVLGKALRHSTNAKYSTALKSMNCINSHAITLQEAPVRPLDVYY